MTRPSLPWARRSSELATWTQAFMVNRSDVFGGYHPIADRGKFLPDGQPLGKTTTRPAKSKRGLVTLSDWHLVRHYRGAAVEHVVGLHSTGPDNRSRWGAVDIDCHGDGGNPPEANLAAALAWYDRLQGLGFAPLWTDSNGAGGHHLLALFDRPVPTPLVFAFLHWLVNDHAAHGLPHRPETFPKQPSIPAGRFGNWLRLPGRHHTKEHWSCVWHGGRWLKGAEAVEFILSLRGSPPDLIPAHVQAAPERRPVQAAPRQAVTAEGLAGLPARIAAYLAKLPRLGAAQGRDDVGYQFACWLVRDLSLSDDEALPWLERWDAGNTPPKGETERKKWLVSARAYGRHEYGSGLGERPKRAGQAHNKGRHAVTVLRTRVEVY